MPRPAPFRRPGDTPKVTVPVAPVRAPQNRWIQRIGDAVSYDEGAFTVVHGTEETFTALLDAIEAQHAGAVEYALNHLGMMDDGPRGYLSWLGRLWFNEDDPVTADVLVQGLDLLRPEVIGLDDEAYRQDVLGLLHLLAALDVDGPASSALPSSESPSVKGPRLMTWLTDLITERPTDLVLAPGDVQEGCVNPSTLRALADRLQAVGLRSTLQKTLQNEGPNEARPRRRL